MAKKKKVVYGPSDAEEGAQLAMEGAKGLWKGGKAAFGLLNKYVPLTKEAKVAKLAREVAKLETKENTRNRLDELQKRKKELQEKLAAKEAYA